MVRRKAAGQRDTAGETGRNPKQGPRQETESEAEESKPQRPLAVLDIETDPFLYGRVPKPFLVGLYRGPDHPFIHWWGNDCIEQAVSYLSLLAEENGEHLIYAHNGGKFDYIYFLPYIFGAIKIINGRIVEGNLCGHTIRDSYSIMPFPLRDYKKDEIDYNLFERENREAARAEILSYFLGDHKYLYDLVATFHAEFGQSKLTIGSTAMGEIKRIHPFPRATLAFDRVFRPTFFHGGRVQCFDKTGIIEGEINIYDVNSSYPNAMRNYLHPATLDYAVGSEITDDTCFLSVTGTNAGAFPYRDRDSGGLTFERTQGTYHVSRHEYDAAICTGTFLPSGIERTYDFAVRDSQCSFVDEFFRKRAEAREVGDDIRNLLFKFVLNSGYGKYAQNPCNFYDWTLATLADRPREECGHCKGSGNCDFRDGCWRCQAINDYGIISDKCCMFCGGDGIRWHLHEFDLTNPTGNQIWKARTFEQSYYNVSIGASITGAARATLLMGLAEATRPLYCDTDSIICDGAFTGDVGKELGQWKFEGAGCLAAVAGKKLYAIFADHPPELKREDERKYPWMLKPILNGKPFRGRRLWCIKKAHKGMRLDPEEIFHIAQGWEIEKANAAPTFGLYKTPVFISRVARKTV